MDPTMHLLLIEPRYSSDDPFASLSKSELQNSNYTFRSSASIRDKLFDSMDKNEDGKVSYQEFINFA